MQVIDSAVQLVTGVSKVTSRLPKDRNQRKAREMAGKKSKKDQKTKNDTSALVTPPESQLDEQPISKGQMEMDDGGDEGDLKVYLPGMALAEGETLEVDPSAYVMLHEMSMEWPCLSFDIVRDGAVGEESTAFPMSGYLVTGTQADQSKKNQLMLLRYTNLHKTIVKDEQDEDEGSDEEEEDEEDEESLNRKEPRHYCISIPHEGGVNRIRSSTLNQDDLVAATWAETGRVHIWNLRESFLELAGVSTEQPSALVKAPSVKPIHTVTGHKNEGFAMDWSPVQKGRLLTGDCDGRILMTSLVVEGGRFETSPEAFTSHAGSVEDIQWSPKESTVFASSSVDQTVRLWDIRMPRKQAALQAHLHNSDINVISWSSKVDWQLASGADDGSFSIWDLRKWTPTTSSQDQANALATFSWHRDAITSIQWNPHDETVLAVAGADDQVTIWDLSAEGSEQPMMIEDRAVPPQLLFIHQGQQHIKEVAWHPQLSGVLISTAASGFNIFKTISV